MGISMLPTTTTTAQAAPTIILITTDKNPTVVYPSFTPPDYGGAIASTDQEIGHASATAGNSFVQPTYGASETSDRGQQIQSGGRKTMAANPATVRVLPTGVVIDGTTIADSPQSKTQTVTVNGNTFTIDPTQVIGAGATIDRPSMMGGVFVPTPTSTNIGGIAVAVTSSLAILDGTTFTLGSTTTTAVVDGQTVTIGPEGIAVASKTLRVSAMPEPTQIVIAGGELVTAIGPSIFVIESTTITYGPGYTSVTVVDGDTITVGAAAVTVHGTTIGGVSLVSTGTEYEIVGGATITEVGASLVVIQGTTFTVGPGATTTTKIVGGETITIGPSGISISTTLSLPYPFGPATTITPEATATGAATTSIKSKDAGMALEPNWLTELFLSCIAIGVWAVGI
ncbi:hypothetical protein NKR23_g4596 [Pleurostoma richardsiae]|uniref:Uncharacterized protein n=1 Tax=Pleurostoma richardsiae TaxID=41990 RepID=A0AA38VS42_9PEZI|nr:hypothetical protein NKR23_g4596 [Pleurostoma richardsiae]